jgi:hypothetical protein
MIEFIIKVCLNKSETGYEFEGLDSTGTGYGQEADFVNMAMKFGSLKVGIG